MNDDKPNGTERPAEVTDGPGPEPGSPEHVLGIIADRLDVLAEQNALLLNNDRIVGEALAMLLSGAARKQLIVQEVETMIQRLDPNAHFVEQSPILHGVPMPPRRPN